jgi:hypothetical protein
MPFPGGESFTIQLREALHFRLTGLDRVQEVAGDEDTE